MAATVRLAVAGVRRRGLRLSLVLVAVTALASAAIVAGLAGRTTAGSLVDDAYERAGRPDMVLYGSAAALRAAAGDDAVDAASPPARRAAAETLVDDEPTEVVVAELVDDAGSSVGAPRLVEGRLPATDDEVVVERSLVTEGVVDVGGTLDLRTDDGHRTVRVVGDAIELSDCFWPNCDPLRVFGRSGLVDALSAEGDLHVTSYRLHDPGAASAVAARLQEADPEGVRGANVWPDTRSDILVVGDVFGAMVAGLGTFLLAAACFVVAGATSARLVARRRSFALLRAVGFRTRQLTAATLAEHLALGVVGVLIGWVVGSLVAPQLGGVDRILDGGSGFELQSLVTALVLVGALLTIAVAVPAWRAGRQPAAEVLQDVPPPTRGGRLVAAALRALGAGPSTVAGVRRTLARPVRAALATGALLVAAVGTVVTAGFIGSVYRVLDDPARTGNPFDGYAVSTGASDAEIAADLDATPEVGSWHTERDGSVTFDDSSYTMRVIGGDDADYRVQDGRQLSAPGEALVGYGFLDETGLDVGDRMTVDLDGTPLDLEIVGWYLDTADGGKMVLLREESLPTGVTLDDSTTFRLSTADGVDPDAMTAAVARRVGDGAAVVTADFGEGIDAIVGTLVVFAQLLAGVALANLIATNVAAARERARSLGVLRTIGCTTRQLVTQSAVGSAVLGLAAAVVGVPLGLVVFDVIADAVSKGTGVGPGLTAAPSPWLLVAVVPALTLLAAGSGAVASLGLSRRPAAELVRYE